MEALDGFFCIIDEDKREWMANNPGVKYWLKGVSDVGSMGSPTDGEQAPFGRQAFENIQNGNGTATQNWWLHRMSAPT